MVLYTLPGCPMCDLLSDRLAQLEVPCSVVTDAEQMRAKGIQTVPTLEDEDGNLMNYAQAVKYLNKGVFAK